MSKKIDKANNINETFSYGIIYVYSIPDKKHEGRLKVGSATVASSSPTQEDINSAAHYRIKQQTKTADIPYSLEHAELAITNDSKYFSDYDVHEVLKRSGYERKTENVKNSHSEWFEINLEVAKKAIQAVKEHRTALTTEEKSAVKTSQFQFRPNQLDAINKTSKAIKKNRKHFLWNAKMRFGKTSAAMQVAKENEMKKVLIVTHRPSVSVDWCNDFNLVLASAGYEFSSKDKGEDIKVLIKNKKPFVHFASLQDLRLSKQVVKDESSGSKAKGFEKNEEIFDTMWDMLIVDEAHEGTQSNLGDTTFSKIPTNFTLQLSGTPFNILHKHEEEDIYTWDYVMEQEEKNNWDENYPGVPNPYAELPSLSIFTYDVDTFANHIGSLGDNFHDSLDGAFKFHEFFRVHKDEVGEDTDKFVHESMVNKFLDLLANDKLATKFPYATQEYRNYNKHALWLLPNRTKVILAMEKLLKEHPVFGSFGIVNISGNNYNEDEDKDAKERVTKAIKDNEYTITLTGQRLTTGASIKEWTAVFMMSDTSSATTYLQTAFRCQTPAKIGGKIKTHGYVFDFAPDRTLKLIAEAIELNHKSGKTNSPEQKDAMGKFLNFCPILAAEGGKMIPYDVGKMLTQLKKAIIDRVSRNGFDDPKLYNDELLKLDQLDIEKFNQLKKIVGNSTSEKINEIKINELGMDDLKTKQAEEIERKLKKELSEEEKEKLKKLKEARDQKKNAISILRAVSIRMPMLVYGAHVSIREDINLKKFIELVDEESWEEFMPEGLTKEGFSEFTKYYDEEVFRGVTKSIRAKAFDCDNLLPTDRIRAITEIFSTFKNPDKETVLTPWNVVSKHLTLAFGGHDFSSGVVDNKTDKPEWISKGVDTSVWEQDDTKILEINSKSGLYPLLAAYNVYSRKIKNIKKSEEKIAKEVWNKVLKENIYVLCKSPMAQSITFRTLAGYDEGVKTNIIYIHDLIKKIQQKDEYKNYNLKVELLEKFNLDKNMKFTAVVGNPPYNEKVSDSDANRALSRQLFPIFIQQSIILCPKYVSLITPSRWFKGEAQDGSFPKLREFIKKNNHISKIVHYPKATEIFPGIVIKGGVSYFLWKEDFVGDVEFTNIINKHSVSMKRPLFEEGLDVILDENESISILKKIIKNDFKSLTIITQGRDAFGIVGKKSELNKITQSKSFTGAVEVRCMNKEIRYAKKDIFKKNVDILNAWKVFVSKSAGDPATDSNVIGSPYIGFPGSVCTDTFIPIGNFKTQQEAKNLESYIKTRFTRYVISIMKVSQNVYQNVYHFVPLQDFTKKSDINWLKSISEIDKQLYKKYGLDKKEIEFIETHVKEMK